MRAQDAPFRPYWWATSLSEAGVESRSGEGTYGRYSFDALPPVPFTLDGSFDWLAHRPAAAEWAIGTEVRAELAALVANCGAALPAAFTRFMGSPDLQARIRSTTACYLDLDAAPVSSPNGGRLIRFLADQQGCLFWYLYLAADGDHAVVSSLEYVDSAEAPTVEEPDAICFCAESFEAFLCRYWLENEIWFASVDGTPMPDVGAAYIERYRELAG